MTILCAIDFSPASQTVLQAAAALAKQLGDSLVVAHAVDMPSVFSPQVLAAERAIVEGLKDNAARQLKPMGDELRARGLTAEERVVVGRPADQLALLAGELQARLVVVGSHGRSSIGRVLLGSVSE